MSEGLIDLLDRFKLPLALSFVGLVLIIGGVFASGLNEQAPFSKAKPKEYPKESLVQSQKLISVDVSGAVNKPGVYQLDEQSRIEEAVNLAGGFSAQANQEYISKTLNQAQKLSDGSKVYVPFIGEQVNNTGSPSIAGVSTSALVNVNTASQSELEALDGIGPSYASKIIAGRPYQTIDELLSKKAVTKSLFEKIKDQLVLY